MLFGFWQLKTTVCALLLASCLGQELFRTCERNTCYERFTESRTREPNVLREWNRSDGENLESQERGDRISVNDEVRLNRENRLNYQLSEEIRQHESKSDVTRHLQERRDALQRFNLRNANRLSEERRHSAEHLDEYRVERNQIMRQLNVHLEDNREERRENRRQLNKRYTAESERITEHEPTQRREENISKSLREIDDREIKQDVNRSLEEYQQLAERVNKNRRANPTSRHIYENNRERVERIEDRATQRDINRRSRDNQQLNETPEYRDTVERIFKRERDEIKRERVEHHRETFERIFKRERDEIKRERVEHHPSLRRLDNGKPQRHVSRGSEDTEILAELSHEDRGDTPESRQIVERLSERECEQTQRRDENKRIRVEERLSQRERETTQRYDENRRERVDERLFERERKLTQQHDENQRERAERNKSLRRLDDHKPQRDGNRHTEDNRELVDGVERLNKVMQPENSEPQREVSRGLRDNRILVKLLLEHLPDTLQSRERKSTQRRDENQRERVERHESFRRLEGYESQRDGSRRSELALRSNVNRLDDRETRRDITRRLEDNRQFAEHLYEKQCDTRESQRPDERLFQTDPKSIQRHDDKNWERIEERLPQREHKSTQQRDENQLERVERHESIRRFDDHESQRGVRRRSEDKRQFAEHLYKHQRHSPEFRLTDERVSQIEHELRERLEDNRMKHELYERREEKKREDERLSQRERKLTLRNENRRERVERHETSRRNDNRESELDGNKHSEDNREFIIRLDVNEVALLNDRETQRDENSRLQNNRKLAERLHDNQHDILESKRIDERLSQMEREITRKRVDNHEVFRRIETRKTHYNPSRHSDNIREQNQIMKSSADNLEEQFVTLRQNQRQVNRRSDFKYESEHTNQHLYEIERESIPQRDTRNYPGTIEGLSQGERAEVHETKRHFVAQRNDNRRSENYGKQLRERQLAERINENKREHAERQNEERNINRYLIDYQEIRNSDKEPLFTKALQLGIEYEKPTNFFKKNYLILGQGAILAFIITKSLNGKHELKLQLPQTLRQAIRMMGF